MGLETVGIVSSQCQGNRCPRLPTYLVSVTEPYYGISGQLTIISPSRVAIAVTRDGSVKSQRRDGTLHHDGVESARREAEAEEAGVIVRVVEPSNNLILECRLTSPYAIFYGDRFRPIIAIGAES